MKKILGLDLGTNSIGWALVDEGNKKIIDTGVRIFQEGVLNSGTAKEQSKNSTRRDARQIRRQYFRRKLRKRKLLKVLNDFGLSPADQLENSDKMQDWLKINPYKVRHEAISQKVSLNELGRAFYHIAQRRGFKSTRKVSSEEGVLFKGKESTKGINETLSEIPDNKTLGSYLYETGYKDGEPFSLKERVRDRYTLREMYVDEFNKIWEKQNILYGNLNPKYIKKEKKLSTGQLINQANTIEIKLKTTRSQIDKYIDTFNYHILGFRSENDFMLFIESPGDNLNNCKVKITPVTTYINGNLNTKSLTPPSCMLSKEYLKLFIDELQRIKIRAFAILENTANKKQVNYQACRNLKIAEYLGVECLNIIANFKLSQNEEIDESIVYIFETLKSFIIKSIEFYIHFFEPYLEDKIHHFKHLLSELEYNYKDQIESNKFISKIISNSIDCTYSSTNLSPEISYAKEKPDSLKIYWNRNINLLATYYLDLVENGIISLPATKDEYGKIKVSKDHNKILDIHVRKFLTNHICSTFLDSKGKPLSPHTVSTYLDPKKPDRRSKMSKGPNLDKFDSK